MIAAPNAREIYEREKRALFCIGFIIEWQRLIYSTDVYS